VTAGGRGGRGVQRLEWAPPVTGGGDGILWLSFVLILVVVLTYYRRTLTGMLFTPAFFATPTGFTSSAPGGPTQTVSGAAPVPGVNVNPSTGAGL
ncbi:MAG: hypothetical protein ACREQ5_10695, partial [Candidatus Dormibacteria bacterium]